MRGKVSAARRAVEAKSLVFFNKTIVIMMHPLLSNLPIVLVQKLPIFSAIHDSRSNLLRHPISFDREDSSGVIVMTLRLEGPDRFVLGASDSIDRSIASALSASASGCVSRRSSSPLEGLRIEDGDMMLA